MTRAVTILAMLCTGCIAHTLATPVEDHLVQAMTIADSCEADGYGNGRCTADDLQAMVDQACLIDAIIKSKPADTCGVAK